MPTPQRLPIVNSDDGTWGDILRQYLMKEHFNDDTDNAANGGHQKITIKGGTASAGTAPIKFTSGTLLTTPETGAFEFAGDNYYLTQTTSTTRKKIAIYDDSAGATGDIYYRNSGGYFTRLAAGSSGSILTLASGIPSWASSIVGTAIGNTNTVTLKDTNFTLQDDGDTTKQAQFQLSGITTGTTRTLTVPNASGTLALTSDITAAKTVVNVKDYGAVGDNSTDNTTAISNAIAAVGTNGVVWFPAGTYRHTGITAVAGVQLRGSGRGRTILRNTHASNTSITMNGTAGGPYLPGASVEALTIDATALRSGQIGISVLLAQAIRVADVEIMTHGIGVQHQAAWENLYQDVHVHNCTTGWYIPVPGSYTSSCPLTLIECHAVDCTTGFKVDDGVQGLTWTGGDFSRCTNGIVLDGNQTGQITFQGMNFEGISGDDVKVGSSSYGPAAIKFIGCRFFWSSTTKTRSVYFQQGDQLVFDTCRWTNSVLVARQDSTTGSMTMVGCSAYGQTHFIDLNGTYGDTITSLVVSTSGSGVSSVGPTGNEKTSTLTASQWLASKVLYGAGKTTISDSDFTTAPVEGAIAGVYNTTDNTFRLAARHYGAWVTMQAYSSNLDAWSAKTAPTGTVVGTTDTQTLTNKTLVLPGTASPAYAQGKLVYDTDNESLTFFNSDSNISLQVGQEEWIRVWNNTGSTIPNGSAVYISGASSGYPTIALAQANAAATTIGAGLATESIANGTSGMVTTLGLVRGIDTSAFTAGQTVYISATTAGALTSTAPTAPNYRYRVGIVGVSNATTGTIHVTPSTAALGNGTANQLFGINNAGTAQEVKSIVGATNDINVTHTANTITLALGSNAVTATSTTTLTNKTLTDPKINSIKDTNGNTIIGLLPAASAVNYLTILNQATGTSPGIYATGADANINLYLAPKGVGAVFNYTSTGQAAVYAADGPDTNHNLNLLPKGTGKVQAGGIEVATISSAQTLTNKTLSAPKIDLVKDANGNTSVTFDPLPNAVNYLSLGNSATGSNVYIDANGSDANIGIDLAPKGNMPVTVWTATGNTPTLSAAGADTNLDLNLTSKGTGVVKAGGIPIVTTTGAQQLTNKIFTPSTASTATAATTTTLTAASAQTQVFTGTAVQTVLMPSTSIVIGQTYTIINQSTGTLSIQSSAGNAITTLSTGKTGVFTAIVSAPTAATHWSGSVSNSGTVQIFPTTTAAIARTDAAQTFTGVQTFSSAPSFSAIPTGAGVASAATASTLMSRDTNKNTFANNVFESFTTTATAAGTTTLTIASTMIQAFTGTTTQTVTLPTTSVPAGAQYIIINQSTGAVTVQSSGANTVATVASNSTVTFTSLVATPTTAAHWFVPAAGGGNMNTTTYDPAGIAQQVVGTTATQTLTNKRITTRVNTVASSATPAINTDTTDQFTITALATAITSMSSSLTGTPTDGQRLMVRIKDNGTAQTISWGASFVSSGIASPLTTTVAGKTHLVGFVYDSAAAKWVCVAVDSVGY